MAACVIETAGVLTLTTDSISTCTGYVLLDALEYSDYPTLSNIFAMPLSTDLAEMWAVGFSLPLIVYLSAWALGTVVNFINSK